MLTCKIVVRTKDKVPAHAIVPPSSPKQGGMTNAMIVVAATKTAIVFLVLRSPIGRETLFLTVFCPMAWFGCDASLALLIWRWMDNANVGDN
jgi:hypothetical protein